MAQQQAEGKNIGENRKARHDYFILESIECGIALTGTEVKSLRLGRLNLRDSHARIENGQVTLLNCHISPYEQGNRYNHEPLRPRKLLLHRLEILKLFSQVREKGCTLVPLRFYFSPRGKVKVELGVCKGKKSYDKRADIAARDAEREMQRAARGRNRDDWD